VTKPKRKRSRIIKVLLVVVIVAAAYVAFDLFAPRDSKMRDFNPDEVARLETAMWRSYVALLLR
jgi:flagellar basal body-associated protein FliL